MSQIDVMDLNLLRYAGVTLRMLFSNAGKILLILLAAIFVKAIVKGIYNIYFHPLRKFPGPWFAAATPIPFCWRILNGWTVPWNMKLHAKYGPVVRVAPDELTFVSSTAWKDIYNTRPELPKCTFGMLATPSGVKTMATFPDPENHTRQRKIVGHAFSPSALKEQESIIQKYSDRLIECLRRQNGEIDIHKWLHYASFDMMGELSFGESFNCLQNDCNHPWVASVFPGVKIAQMMTVLEHFWPLLPLVKLLLPPHIKRKARKNFEYTQQAIDRRIKSKSTRPDFLRFMFENNHAGGMTRAEIDATSLFLVLAGSDTTALTMATVIYFCLKNPHTMVKLQKEVRETFGTGQNITSTSASELPYMHAVILEALRIHSPPAISVPRDVDRPGIVVSGYPIPVGTRVGIPGKTAHRSPINFVDPDSFVPERFLPDADPKYGADKKEAFEPFMVGPRNCLGKPLAWAEMNSTLAKIFLNFNFELSDRMTGDWSNTRLFLVHEKRPLWVKIKSQG